MTIVQVALDVPLPKLFDYIANDVSQADIGRRVIVPFGGRSQIGIIVSISQDSTVPMAKLRSCTRVVRETPPLPAAYLELGTFCANYYQFPIGMALMAGIPPRLRRRGDGIQSPRLLTLTTAGINALTNLPDRQKINKRILRLLHENPRLQRL